MWIFGYGSLIWRPDFPHDARVEGRIRGWKRRFWQGSPDHRGTPEAPGRVVTLLREAGGEVWGAAYRIPADQVATVLPALDFREQAGYERIEVRVEPLDGGECVDATCYVASPDNACFLGPAPLAEMAAHIARSVGPSGPNAAYLLELADALRAMGVDDPHVFALADAVREL